MVSFVLHTFFVFVVLLCRSVSYCFMLSNPSHFPSSHLFAELSNDEISRYSRHLVLSDVGVAGQKQLKGASVLVIGAGGLGSPALLYLAAAGVGQLGIVDGDTVDASNLQRQIIHSVATVGETKCASAQTAIHNLNPFVNVRLYTEEFTAETAERIVQGGFGEGKPWDVIVDGSDNFPTKYLINDVCAMHGIPWVYSAILAFEGQLSVFNVDSESPDYRDLLPVPPNPGDVPSCAEGGVLGLLPGTMGCLQATEVVKLILGRTEGLASGRVILFDAMAMTFSETKLERIPSRDPITELIDYKGFCGGPKTPTTSSPPSTETTGRTMDEAEQADESSGQYPDFHSLSSADCMDKLKHGWSPWVLDVRLQTEHEIVHLPFTDHVVPHRKVKMTDIPSSGDVLVYCKAGVRGKKACSSLIASGVSPDRLYNLEGGIMGWQKTVDPSMPRY